MSKRVPLQKPPTKISAGLGLSQIDRAAKEFFADRCSAGDLQKLRDYFSAEGELQCFYCESPSPNRWDHLHPVSRGGDTALGNLVPACARCDDSKQDRDIEDWVSSNSLHRPSADRLEMLLSKVARYRQEFEYAPVAWEEKLSPEQRESYARIQRAITELRACLVEEGVLRARPASSAKSR